MKHTMKTLIHSFLFIALCLNLTAQEIAQWRGENRDGVYKETNLLKQLI